MKYVKIWDKIYSIDKITEKYARIHDTDDLTTYHYDIELDDNSAQFSDTIEELCDEIVPIYQNDIKPCDDFMNTEGITFYGAIWTDKGLIYVAKRNDKGELELI